MAKRKRTKCHMINKTLLRKLKIEQHEPFKKTRLNSGASKGYAVPAPLVVRTHHVRFDISSHFKLNKITTKY